MDLLESRATAAGEAEQDQLRHAILAAVLYLNELGEQGARTGGFTHQEPGRGAMLPIKDLNIQRHILSTQFAMYGLSSFAAKGVAVDANLADKAFELCGKAWRWLDDNGGRDVVLDSIVAIRMGRAAERAGLPSAVDWLAKARSASQTVLEIFGAPEALAQMLRPTLRSIPWFEGVHFDRSRCRAGRAHRGHRRPIGGADPEPEQRVLRHPAGR